MLNPINDKNKSMEDILSEQIDQMGLMRQKQEELHARIVMCEERIAEISAKATRPSNEYFSISGYASLRGIKVDVNRVSTLDRMAVKMSHNNGYEIREMGDPRYGSVYAYHLDILKEVFKAETRDRELRLEKEIAAIKQQLKERRYLKNITWGDFDDSIKYFVDAEEEVEMDEMVTTLKNENEELKKELALYKKGESVKILEIPLPYAAEITEHMAQEGERITKIIIVTEKF